MHYVVVDCYSKLSIIVILAILKEKNETEEQERNQTLYNRQKLTYKKCQNFSKTYFPFVTKNNN